MCETLFLRPKGSLLPVGQHFLISTYPSPPQKKKKKSLAVFFFF